jgi:cytochrome P450
MEAPRDDLSVSTSRPTNLDVLFNCRTICSRLPFMADFDPYDLQRKQDPYPDYATMRQTCPVHHFVLPPERIRTSSNNPWVAHPTEELYSVFRHEDVAHVLRCHEVFGNKEGPGPERMQQISEDGMLLVADEPAHRRQRNIVNKAFTPRTVRNYEPEIQKIADELVDGLRPKGKADLVSDYAAHLTIRAIAKITGVDDSRIDDFYRWGTDLVQAFGADEATVERSMTSGLEFFAYMTSLITPRREARARGEDLPDDVLSALMTAEDEGWHLDDQELLVGCQQFMTAGFETAMTTLASAIYLLCTHPEQRGFLEEDPSLIEVLIEETLRYMSPLDGICRTALEDTTLGGVQIPRGAKVRLVLAAAGRDGDQFDRPDEFDLTRDRLEARRHLTFGAGIHTCIGAALARAELRIGITTLLAGLPGLELDPDDPPTPVDAMMLNGFRKMPVRWKA